MSTESLTPGTTTAPCRVLVVDDDRRVRELLEITLTTNGFAVITASDGEEALMRARRERPDLILLDVRLPRRSGLEVCDVLRNDPTDPAVPIILITAASETEHRLQGFLRGADDVMAKPFSPKELVARMRRLLARATETRASVRRTRELERELVSVRREARHAEDDARREHDRLETASGPGRDLLGVLELDALAGQLLSMAQVRLRSQVVSLLVADPGRPTLRALAVRGAQFERIGALTLDSAGEFKSLLEGLARPVRVADLPRLGASSHAVAALVAGRWDVIMPLTAAGELEGVLLAEEPGLASEDVRLAWDELIVLGSCAGVALSNARRVREQARWLLASVGEHVYRGAESANAFVEARLLLDRCARTLDIHPGEREVARHALELSEWTHTPEGAAEFDRLCASDASGVARGTRALIHAASSELTPESDRLTVLVAAVDTFRSARARGLDPGRALERAREKAAPDSFVVESLAQNARFTTSTERDAA